MATFALLVNHSPYGQQSTISAYQFCIAALELGHYFNNIFFLEDGVYHGHCLDQLVIKELSAVEKWCALARQHSLPLTICISAALKRGIYDESEAKRYHQKYNLAPEFKLASLGEFIEHATIADRVIIF